MRARQTVWIELRTLLAAGIHVLSRSQLTETGRTG